MTTATKPTPEITRAAERYLEQYGDPLVMNTYLKVIILVLAVVCLTLAALVFRGQKALASMHPLIVRINDVLPAPLAPTMATMAPSSISSDTPSSACASP